jgi:lambda repressor-like predicted transcriptional regulator
VRRIWKILVISMVLAGLLATILAVTVAAAGPRGTDMSAAVREAGLRGNASGNCYGQAGNTTIDVVSKLLDMTPEEIQAERQAGKSLVQIAAGKNVTEEVLINAIIAEKEAATKELVTAGTITQEQADLRLTQMKENVKLAVNRTTVGQPDWAGSCGIGSNGACGGNGALRQGGCQGDPENCTGTPGTGTGMGRMMRGNRIAQ